QDPSAEGEDDPVAEVKLQLWSLLFAMLYGKLRSGAAPHEAPHEAPPLPDQPRVTTDCRDFLSRLHNRDPRERSCRTCTTTLSSLGARGHGRPRLLFKASFFGFCLAVPPVCTSFN
ncbi:unnamed protein product, partial [Prorocentrum cordatum]